MGLFDKIKKGLQKTRNAFSGRMDELVENYKELDDDFYEDLTDILIMADVGVPTSELAVNRLKEKCKAEKIGNPEKAREALKEILADILWAEPMKLTSPMVLLIIGVNGVGKTTSIGKLASRLKAMGRRVIICAGDTFRAAAADQLTVWAERADVPIIKHREGADPAAVVFDGIQAAKGRHTDVLLVDTAGRLHNKAHLMEELKKILVDILWAEPMKLTSPMVLLVIGVNGVGKTTSIGKLASRLKAMGRRVIICAGDTFRAAAADQLTVWAERADVPIIKHREGADPAAVVFDGIQAAKGRHADVLLVDTAGRLHNKAHLMEELKKMARVVEREYPEATTRALLVIDATTGQNGLVQADVFKDVTDLDGIILTKLDGTAKGGIAIAIRQELGLPVRYIGIGEQLDDMHPFEAKDFVDAIF